MMPDTLWTVGHSTRDIVDFIRLLKEHQIDTLADVRHFPGSNRYPQFNADALRRSLEGAGIQYAPFVDLGGRRYSTYKASHNNRWRLPSFRSYADYTETDVYEEAASRLSAVASEHRTAIMCAEAVWWRCHRSIISDWYKSRGTKVLHIITAGKAPQEHPYTSPALIVNGKLSYHDPDLLDVIAAQ